MNVKSVFKPFFVAITLIACNNNVPCDYDIRKFHAEVKEIKPFESNEYDNSVEMAGNKYYHVLMEFDQRPLSEELQYLDKLENIQFDSILLDLNHIQPGNIYSGLLSVRTSGRCEKMFVSFNQGFIKDYK